MLSEVIPPQTGILHQERNCKLNLNRRDVGDGSLYVSEEKLFWENCEHRGLALDYREIAIHAISTDLQAFPEECLYVMYNGKLQNGAAMNGDSQDENESEDVDFGSQYTHEITEIRFVPQCKDSLTTMFNAMNDAQCLHPDSEDSDDYYDGGDNNETAVEYNPNFEDGATGGFYMTEEGFDHLSPQGQATLERLENMLAQSDISDQMTGVIISDEEEGGDMDESNPPLVGRVEDVKDSDEKTTDGQFDDAD